MKAEFSKHFEIFANLLNHIQIKLSFLQLNSFLQSLQEFIAQKYSIDVVGSFDTPSYTENVLIKLPPPPTCAPSAVVKVDTVTCVVSVAHSTEMELPVSIHV